jgi:hypothetical protein
MYSIGQVVRYFTKWKGIFYKAYTTYLAVLNLQFFGKPDSVLMVLKGDHLSGK